jgi:hypothetical protein
MSREQLSDVLSLINELLPNLPNGNSLSLN